MSIIDLRPLVVSVDPQYHSVLNSYVSYIFDNPESGETKLFEQVCKYWLALVLGSDECLIGFKSHWFLFEVMFKSMVLYLQDNGQLHSTSRANRFTANFYENLTQLIGELTMLYHDDFDAIVAFPIFMNRLFSIIDRGVVFKMV